MTTTRRSFLKGIIGAASTFIVPELILPERRFWQLDRTMIGAPTPIVWAESPFDPPTLQAGMTYWIRLDTPDNKGEWTEWPRVRSFEWSYVEQSDRGPIAVFVPEGSVRR